MTSTNFDSVAEGLTLLLPHASMPSKDCRKPSVISEASTITPTSVRSSACSEASWSNFDTSDTVSTADFDALSTTSSVQRQTTVKVTVVPGDDSWEGQVIIAVPATSTLGDVKMAVADLVGRPDIKKYGKLVRKKEDGAMMILKETAPLASKRQVSLVNADGLEWPPKPVPIKITDARDHHEVLRMRTDCTILSVKKELARKLGRPELMGAFLGRRAGGGFQRFEAYGDDELVGTRRMLLIEGASGPLLLGEPADYDPWAFGDGTPSLSTVNGLGQIMGPCKHHGSCC